MTAPSSDVVPRAVTEAGPTLMSTGPGMAAIAMFEASSPTRMVIVTTVGVTTQEDERPPADVDQFVPGDGPADVQGCNSEQTHEAVAQDALVAGKRPVAKTASPPTNHSSAVRRKIVTSRRASIARSPSTDLTLLTFECPILSNLGVVLVVSTLLVVPLLGLDHVSHPSATASAAVLAGLA